MISAIETLVQLGIIHTVPNGRLRQRQRFTICIHILAVIANIKSQSQLSSIGSAYLLDRLSSRKSGDPVLLVKIDEVD